jgi:voltage-gated potassium channel
VNHPSINRRQTQKKLRTLPQLFAFWLAQPLSFFALALSIPAFYLELTGPGYVYQNSGRLLYAVMAIILFVDLVSRLRKCAPGLGTWRKYAFDILIFLGALVSAWRVGGNWSSIEWMMRLAYCGIVFVRLSMVLVKWIVPSRLPHILAIAALVQVIAGAGFYWLEPDVHTFSDGIWLAFTTAATVGFGDLVPSTPASRIFSVFIVLFGYALFSIVTASISAMLVGEDEKRFEREFHADIRYLRDEISELREEIRLLSKTDSQVHPQAMTTQLTTDSRECV